MVSIYIHGARTKMYYISLQSYDYEVLEELLAQPYSLHGKGQFVDRFDPVAIDSLGFLELCQEEIPLSLVCKDPQASQVNGKSLPPWQQFDPWWYHL